MLEDLKDIAFNKEIRKEFKNQEGIRTSLLRFSESQKILSEIEYILDSKKNKNHIISFDVFWEGFINDKININFTKINELPNRINVIIGKNGTGKTRFLSDLSACFSGLSKDNRIHLDDSFNSPFSKYIAISYSIFDNFNKNIYKTSHNNGFIDLYEMLKSFDNINIESTDFSENQNIIKKIEDLKLELSDLSNRTRYSNDNVLFSYVYCGLRSRTGLLSEQQINNNYISSLKKIKELDRYNIWIKIISKFIEFESISIGNEDDTFSSLSSGQKILLFIITEVIENISRESLLIIDEPETHLHPNIISKFMIMINDILEEFDSYAIISTHSPILIQEIPSMYVRVFDKIENFTFVREINEECFGENLSNIISYVFNVELNESNYKMILKSLSQKVSKDGVIDIFKNKLSLNALTFLNTLYYDKGEQD